MSMPAPPRLQQRPVAEMVERHDLLRSIMEWIADRFAEEPKVDDTIAWEDGEEHDEPNGSPTL